MQWVLEGGRVLRRGSKKGLSRRQLEGGNTPFKSTTPLACHPSCRGSCLDHGEKKVSREPRQAQSSEYEVPFVSKEHDLNFLGLPSLQKCVLIFLVTFDLEFDLLFAISDGKKSGEI